MTGKRKAVGAVVGLIALIGSWAFVARFAGFDHTLIASPANVVSSFASESELLFENAWITTREALLGLTLAVGFGFMAAILLHRWTLLRDATYPLLISSQSVPIVVIAPLLVLLLGYGLAPKVLIVALVCFFPIVVSTLDGLRSADPELVRMMHSLGASRWRTLRLVELPGALPRFASGVRMASTWVFVAAVFAEYAGSDSGLGYLIARGTPTFETGRVYAAVVLLVAASLALYGLMAALERRLLPWAAHDRQ
ncbi:MAG: ABC transporter permease [Thermoleophilaceae bacterium]|nr:ABC transporter permease [Thermoleophilaceae bacterium]